jgi:uncharacterized membrane protein YkgB
MAIPKTSTTGLRNSTAPCIPATVIWLNRIALFVIFFWFGLLKIIDHSPAETLIVTLHRATLVRNIPIGPFLESLGAAECIIGLLWLIPALTRYTLVIFLAQMTTTLLPLIILPDQTWSKFFVLSLSGQYILKNIVLIACAFTLYTDCRIHRWGKKS